MKWPWDFHWSAPSSGPASVDTMDAVLDSWSSWPCWPQHSWLLHVSPFRTAPSSTASHLSHLPLSYAELWSIHSLPWAHFTPELISFEKWKIRAASTLCIWHSTLHLYDILCWWAPLVPLLGSICQHTLEDQGSSKAAGVAVSVHEFVAGVLVSRHWHAIECHWLLSHKSRRKSRPKFWDFCFKPSLGGAGHGRTWQDRQDHRSSTAPAMVALLGLTMDCVCGKLHWDRRFGPPGSTCHSLSHTEAAAIFMLPSKNATASGARRWQISATAGTWDSGWSFPDSTESRFKEQHDGFYPERRPNTVAEMVLYLAQAHSQIHKRQHAHRKKEHTGASCNFGPANCIPLQDSLLGPLVSDISARHEVFSPAPPWWFDALHEEAIGKRPCSARRELPPHLQQGKPKASKASKPPSHSSLTSPRTSQGTVHNNGLRAVLPRTSEEAMQFSVASERYPLKRMGKRTFKTWNLIWPHTCSNLDGVMFALVSDFMAAQRPDILQSELQKFVDKLIISRHEDIHQAKILKVMTCYDDKVSTIYGNYVHIWSYNMYMMVRVQSCANHIHILSWSFRIQMDCLISTITEKLQERCLYAWIPRT